MVVFRNSNVLKKKLYTEINNQHKEEEKKKLERKI